MSISCGVVERPDHHCGDDLVSIIRELSVLKLVVLKSDICKVAQNFAISRPIFSILSLFNSAFISLLYLYCTACPNGEFDCGKVSAL